MLLLVAGLMIHTNAKLDSDSANKLKDSWTNFVQSLLTSNSSCYKTVTDYGTIQVAKPDDTTCDLKVIRKGESVCIHVNKGASSCSVTTTISAQPVIKVELTVRSIFLWLIALVGIGCWDAVS